MLLASGSQWFGVCEFVGTLIAERFVRQWIQFLRLFRRVFGLNSRSFYVLVFSALEVDSGISLASWYGEVHTVDASVALWLHGERGS